MLCAVSPNYDNHQPAWWRTVVECEDDIWDPIDENRFFFWENNLSKKDLHRST